MSKGSKGSSKYPHIAMKPTRTGTTIRILECSCCDNAEESEMSYKSDTPAFHMCKDCISFFKEMKSMKTSWKLN